MRGSIDSPAFIPLSDREQACMRLVAQHLRTKQIAREFGTTPNTVDRQIASACRKLGVADRQAAIRLLLSNGLLDMPDNPAGGSSTISPMADLAPLHEATEDAPNEQQEPRHLYSHVEMDRVGGSVQSPRARSGPGGNDPPPGQFTEKAGPVSQQRNDAAGGLGDSGLRGGSELSPRVRGIAGFGPGRRLLIIAVIALLSGLTVAGLILVAAATLTGLHTLLG